ncbi:hypothetical protein TSOC_008990, partial [Tetrabaena socialis]
GEHNKVGSTPVADDWNWTSRVRSELNQQAAWQRNWGFLLDQKKKEQQDGTGTAAADSLAAFMQQARLSGGEGTLNYIQAKQRDSARARKHSQQDSLDGFVSTYMAKDPHGRALPVEEFRKPLTTSHQYGWGRNLEVFGKMPLVMK